MQITEVSAEGLKRVFNVTVPAAEIGRQVEEKLKDISTRIRMPGFRPGKVPPAMVKKLHGQAVLGEVLEETVNAATQQAFADKNLRPALQPEIKVEKFGENDDLEYSVSVEVLPDITPGDFSAITLERLVARVPDDQIDSYVKDIAEQQKNYAAAEEGYAAQSGDAVVIDFLGKVDGVAFEGGAAEDYQLVLGSNSFIPGFEDQLVGVKAGDKKDVNVEFPADYGSEDLAGKAAVFEVTVKDVRKPEAVSLDDEFAKKLGLESLDALKNVVREQMQRENDRLSRLRLKRGLLDALAASHDFDVPQGMVDLEYEQIIQQVKRESGEENGEVSEEDATEFKSIALRRVRLGLLLAEVGNRNNITVRQDEVNRLVAEQARRFPGQEKKVFEFYQGNPEALAQLRAPLLEEKVVDYIVELAQVTDRDVSLDELNRSLNEDDEALSKTDEKPKAKKASKAKAAADEPAVAAEGGEAEAAEKPKKKTAKKKTEAE